MAALLPPGQTRVLAYVHRWTLDAEDPGTLRAIRAQLRGLGAELIILSDAGVWSFRADDPPEQPPPTPRLRQHRP